MRLATDKEINRKETDGEGSLDCVICANPRIDWSKLPTITHALSENCVLRDA